MAFRWRADIDPHMVVFGSSLLSTTKNKKNPSKLDPLAKLSGSGGGGGGEAGGPDTPPEKSQTYNNSGRDSLKKWKATKLALNVGPLAARMPNTI